MNLPLSRTSAPTVNHGVIRCAVFGLAIFFGCACAPEQELIVAPTTMESTAWSSTQFTLSGLRSSTYLDVRGEELRAVDDLSVRFGSSDTNVKAIDGSHLFVALVEPLAPGVYNVVLHARGRDHTAVSPVRVIAGDSGVTDASDDGSPPGDSGTQDVDASLIDTGLPDTLVSDVASEDSPGVCTDQCTGGSCPSGCCSESCDNVCNLSCPAPCTCQFDCFGTTGDCVFICASGSTCDIVCRNVEDCQTECGGDSSCNVLCDGNRDDCELSCNGGARCLVDCTGAIGTCEIRQCTGGSGLLDCGSGITVCNRPCP